MTGQRYISCGRGGVGNMVDREHAPPPPTPKDLETPVLRSPFISTGRGGTGNMVRNDDPERTRALQDVVPVRRSSQTITFAGRGGAGNVIMPETEEEAYAAAAQADAMYEASVRVAKDALRDSLQASRSNTEKGTQDKPEKSLFSKVKGWLSGKKRR